MKYIITGLLLILSFAAAAQFTPRTNINGYPRFLNAHQDTLGVLRNVGGGTGSWGRVRVGDIDTAALRAWFGPGGGTADGNNLTTGISFNNQRLTLTRSGLSSLNADIDTAFLSTVRAVRDSLVTIRTLLDGKQNTGNYSLVGHSHVIGDITGLSATLSTFLTSESDPTVSAWAKAPVKPSYTYAEISGTPTTWPWASLTGVPATFTPSAHGHVIGDVTGLQTALDSKGDVFTSGSYTNPAWITSLAWSKITGAPAFITGNQTITLTGNVTGTGTTSIATTIGANVVTNAMLAQVATGSFLGRVTAGTGNVETLTGTQATTLLDNFTASLKGVVPASGGGTVNFLRADGTWAPPPGGGGGINTLNTLTAGTQTFATGNTGTDFNISSATSTHTFNIPDASATARGVVTTGTQTIAGSKTFTSNLLVSPAGSTYGSPRLVGLGGFGVGEAVRLYIGDEANAIQNGEGSKLDMYSFWGIRLAGNRNTGTPLVIDGIRSSADPSVDVIGTSGTNTVLRAKGAPSQTGNLQEWSNDANTALASMSAAGLLTSAGNANTGVQAISSTQSITSGTATTAANNVFRVEINPASVLATHTLTLPAAPVNGQIVQVHAGGTIPAGAAVVTAFTVSPNAGQTLYAAITPTQLLGGDIMEFTYYTSSTRWIRTK